LVWFGTDTTSACLWMYFSWAFSAITFDIVWLFQYTINCLCTQLLHRQNFASIWVYT
jgi:hypothetical protein